MDKNQHSFIFSFKNDDEGAINMRFLLFVAYLTISHFFPLSVVHSDDLTHEARGRSARENSSQRAEWEKIWPIYSYRSYLIGR